MLAYRLSSSRVGSSVPRASAPMVSMMRLTHSIITALRGVPLPLWGEAGDGGGEVGHSVS